MAFSCFSAIKKATICTTLFFSKPIFTISPDGKSPARFLVLTPEPEKDSPGYEQRAKAPREILFLPQRVPSQEKWTGRKLGPDDADAPAATGFGDGDAGGAL